MPSLPASENYYYIAMVTIKYRAIIITIRNTTVTTPVHFAIQAPAIDFSRAVAVEVPYIA